jgi:uncharacterized Fe-S center protein
MRTNNTETLPGKLRKLIETAGIADIDFNNKFTAIKMHFGETGNLAYLRPNYARVVVDKVRELGGLPFLTDCNTLYPGRRKNALEHLDLAYEHGFSPFSTGCHIIIGDGLRGSDETIVPFPKGEYIKEARVGHAIMDADVVISLTHFKGHMETGFGGTLKNIGMGCGSRAGKMEMHSSSHPVIDLDKCIGCGVCARYCANGAIYYKDKKAHIDADKCVRCGHCIAACSEDAIGSPWDSESAELDMKIAEYATAVLMDRPAFHISLAIDISPLCDCWQGNDAPIVPDIGMFASFDPVALDKACADAVNAQDATMDSRLGEALCKMHKESDCTSGDKTDGTGGHSSDRHDGGQHEHAHHGKLDVDYFTAVGPSTDWHPQVDHAEKLGLGSSNYELIEI